MTINETKFTPGKPPGVPVFLGNDPYERSCPCCYLALTRDGLYCWRCGWEAWQRIEALYGEEVADYRIRRLRWMIANDWMEPSLADVPMPPHRGNHFGGVNKKVSYPATTPPSDPSSTSKSPAPSTPKAGRIPPVK
jgi:hypothetical protein